MWKVKKMVIPCGKRGNESLTMNISFVTDGTFENASEQFSQIYTKYAD